MAELTYTKVGDYYIPDLALDPESAEPVRTVGKYGSLRRSYLKQHKHDLWRELAVSGNSPPTCWTLTIPPRSGWTGCSLR